MEQVDFFWSFRSHYCYLSAERVKDLAARYAIAMRLRPVLPIAIRNPEFFTSLPRTGPDRWAYVRHDTERTAERLGLPFDWPDPDPVIMDMQSFAIATEQPYIYWLTRLGIEAARQGKGLEFASKVATLIFGGTRNWNHPENLAPAVASCDLDLEQMQTSVAAATARYDAEIDANEQALNAAGHWGVPTLAIRGEAFFGQDRLIDFEWRLQQLGIKPLSD